MESCSASIHKGIDCFLARSPRAPTDQPFKYETALTRPAAPPLPAPPRRERGGGGDFPIVVRSFRSQLPIGGQVPSFPELLHSNDDATDGMQTTPLANVAVRQVKDATAD